MDDDVHVCECIMYVFMHACMYSCTYERMCARMFGYNPNSQRPLTSSLESAFLPPFGAAHFGAAHFGAAFLLGFSSSSKACAYAHMHTRDRVCACECASTHMPTVTRTGRCTR